MVESIYLGLNFRFDVNGVYLWLSILLMVDDVFINSETLFDNLKIKLS
jgi:hypothetical protein